MLQGVGHILRKCIEDGERICAVTACRGMLVTELKLPISCRDSQGYLVVTQSELREVKPKVGYEVSGGVAAGMDPQVGESGQQHPCVILR